MLLISKFIIIIQNILKTNKVFNAQKLPQEVQRLHSF